MFSFLKSSRKTVLKNGQVLVEAFKKSRQQLFRLSLISVGLTFLSLLIVGLKFFYPFHMILGISIYILSFIPLTRRIYLSRQTWKKYHLYSWSTSFFKRERWRLLLTVVFITFIISFFWLRPLDEKPFAGLTDKQISEMVTDDIYQSVTAMDYLESSGNELITALSSGREDQNFNDDITNSFTIFLEAVAFSESLTDKHRYFASLPYRLWDERVSSFLISYSLYVKKYELMNRIIVNVSRNEYLKKVLNQHILVQNKDGVYSEMVNRFYEPKTRLRLLGGYLYMKIFVRLSDVTDNTEYDLLRDKAVESYNYLNKNSLQTIFQGIEVLGDNVEYRMFDTWFPIQKTVATGMGRAILTTRGKDGFITEKQAVEMAEIMQPSDIMLQRRNWHVSNVGIPGFWTHSALYTGSLKIMDEYFSSEFPYEGFEDMSSYLKTKYPAVYENYMESDKDGNQKTVIEAIERGVVLQSISTSADADFVVVLRADLSKHDKFLSVLRALSNFGKPYDFNFDFDTRDAIVSSELVYDAYSTKLPEKMGLEFKTSIVNGRKIVSPLDIANKFVNEHETDSPSLVFVYFLRGSETEQTAIVGSEGDFIESVGWSKFSFLQNE
jgi:hypothetical protein